MAKSRENISQTLVPAELSVMDKGDDGSPRLRGLDTNPQGEFGPLLWQAFRDTVVHLYTMTLPHPSEEARFTLSTRTYPTPRAILMRTQGTAITMSRRRPPRAAPSNCSFFSSSKARWTPTAARGAGASSRAMSRSSTMRGRSAVWRAITPT